MAERRAHANVKCFHECDDGDSEMLFELENAMRCDALNCMCECMYLCSALSAKHGMTLDGTAVVFQTFCLLHVSRASAWQQCDDDAPVHGNKPRASQKTLQEERELKQPLALISLPQTAQNQFRDLMLLSNSMFYFCCKPKLLGIGRPEFVPLVPIVIDHESSAKAQRNWASSVPS
ncbi:hypothetical protein NA56DRAFT_713618 [Hyaloscypha hepaticicola]|uniref:Uncharacterized protein n=1 Tax=Hyaloscypha hepaticicola TaxID=2082293 RepID=A0A2J6PD90_9HELO|nr:hypothetical protein NA56DRAFT_713618 [Hyaloscypha hepaticicola]